MVAVLEAKKVAKGVRGGFFTRAEENNEDL